jgi:hypothetical protein
MSEALRCVTGNEAINEKLSVIIGRVAALYVIREENSRDNAFPMRLRCVQRDTSGHGRSS